MKITSHPTKKISRISLLVIASVIAAGAIVPFAYRRPTAAISGAEFNAGRIIDDAIFYSPSTMTVAQIQAFLNQKVPTCDTNGTGSYGGTTRAAYGASKGNAAPFTCLKDYSQNVPAMIRSGSDLCPVSIPASGVKSAAQIIYDVAQSCQVNPQVLLVILEKEQGLVTDTWPWAIQYRSATGYGCPDTAPCDSEYYGFFNQVFQSAQAFKRYAANSANYNYRAGRNNSVLFNPSTSCGSSTVYIENQATAGLYTYTPYQPNQAALNNLYGSGDSCSSYGNRNFWRLFSDWFGSTLIGKQISPLYKSTAGSTIYAVLGTVKYPIANPEVMQAFGLSRYPVASVSDAFLNAYSTGATVSTTLAKKANDNSGTLYVFDDGKRYPVPITACKQMPDGSAVANSSWMLDCFNSNVAQSLPNELIDKYTVQDISLPILTINNNAVWKIENGTKRRVTDPVFVDILGGWGTVRQMQAVNNAQPEGQLLIPDNSLVKFDNSPTIYYLVNAVLYPVPSPSEMAAWNLYARPVYALPAQYNAPMPLTVSPAPLGFFAKDFSGNSYIILSNGTKAALQASPAAWGTAPAVTFPSTVLSGLPTVAMPTVFRSTAGTIFIVRDNQRLPFPTIDDLTYSGYSVSQIKPVDPSVEQLLTYGGMKLSPGRLFKVQGSDTIRYVLSDSASLTVNSTNIPGLPYSKLITVDTTTAARYPVVGNL